MLIENKQIAIVGGGPGGLILARLLQLKGATVKVYERDLNKNARLIGSPLDMHENSGMAALRQANLVEEFKKNFHRGADTNLIVNERAEIFSAITKPKRRKISVAHLFVPKLTAVRCAIYCWSLCSRKR